MLTCLEYISAKVLFEKICLMELLVSHSLVRLIYLLF